jgi:Transglutaminase-like superfamily
MNNPRRFFFALQHAVRRTAVQPRDAFLSARMAAWVVVLSAVARLTSLPRAQKIAIFNLRSGMPRKVSRTPAQLAQTIDSILQVNLFVFRPSCWKRSLVLHRYLALNGIASTIRFGVRREGGNKVDGHAWLEHNGRPLLEDNAASFVITFSLPADHSIAGQTVSYLP